MVVKNKRKNPAYIIFVLAKPKEMRYINEENDKDLSYIRRIE